MGDGSILPPGTCDRLILVWEKDGDSRGGDGPDGGGHMKLVGGLRGHIKALLCLAVESDLVCSGS
jgi:hypothetical protein